jgi:hypothetical protein
MKMQQLEAIKLYMLKLATPYLKKLATNLKLSVVQLVVFVSLLFSCLFRLLITILVVSNLCYDDSLIADL